MLRTHFLCGSVDYFCRTSVLLEVIDELYSGVWIMWHPHAPRRVWRQWLASEFSLGLTRLDVDWALLVLINSVWSGGTHNRCCLCL